MAEYRISGVWKAGGVITHYAVHQIVQDGTTKASKTSKTAAIALVETPGNTVTTWVWNYTRSFWNIGETVHVVNASAGKYLRSNADNKLTDNLSHLINFDWIAP
ncbi:DUF3892 domain-containing protein [Hymenobacter jeollabukensis]|uniref:DUF3892 domain-containing protein n=1 Tax=Hymenobacter jeollabukensis TaxID=2025313 RepID=A0A5R8WV21_9BACT|nr:DUF3892 domain-containing protein [Hymenobacter jeollabukensis]